MSEKEQHKVACGFSLDRLRRVTECPYDMNEKNLGKEPSIFKVVMIDDAVLPSKTCQRDSEDRYRSGYLHGWIAASDFFYEVSMLGYSRHREIFNMAMCFCYGDLTDWRKKNIVNGNLVPPPQPKLPKHWRQLRADMIKKTPACVVCGGTHRLEIDHIVQVKKGGLPIESNLRVLCARCHSERN